MIGFAARGAADLCAQDARKPATELAALLGATRARIAMQLAVPASTTGLAEQLGLAPSTVSRHLSALHDTGLVERVRRGPVVLYRLSARGAALLDLFA